MTNEQTRSSIVALKAHARSLMYAIVAPSGLHPPEDVDLHVLKLAINIYEAMNGLLLKASGPTEERHAQVKQ